MVRTQVTVFPPWGQRSGCEGQRREWAGLSLDFPLEGPGEEDDDDDYENTAPLYKDLPPKPGKRNSQRPGEEMCDLRDEVGEQTSQGELAGHCRHTWSACPYWAP